ncbi:hypothetical protein KM043_008099 [Ampulex compressa]|nr:hypothetical protein KM043_008099 [Ampulex compressa]
MQATKNIISLLYPKCSLPTVFVQMAGFKTFLPPKPKKEIEYPERRKLKVLEKQPHYPPGQRLFTMQRRLRYIRGPEPIHNMLLHKQFGIIAVTGGRMKHVHIEVLRLAVTRVLNTNRMFAIWRIDAPWQPISKRALGHRMGGGKSPIDHYVTPIKAGRVIMELGGDCEFFEIERTLRNAANKMPFSAKVVSQEMLDSEKAREKWYEEKNLNQWTWKYMIQNNMIGCQRWIKPNDARWFNKYH